MNPRLTAVTRCGPSVRRPLPLIEGREDIGATIRIRDHAVHHVVADDEIAGLLFDVTERPEIVVLAMATPWPGASEHGAVVADEIVLALVRDGALLFERMQQFKCGCPANEPSGIRANSSVSCIARLHGWLSRCHQPYRRAGAGFLFAALPRRRALLLLTGAHKDWGTHAIPSRWFADP